MRLRNTAPLPALARRRGCGYIMSAKVGTGIVAELGAMRINEEIDALEVMGARPITFLAATRIVAAWIVL